MYTSCSADVLSLQFSIFMNNLSSYCGLVSGKMRASDIDLPVPKCSQLSKIVTNIGFGSVAVRELKFSCCTKQI